MNTILDKTENSGEGLSLELKQKTGEAFAGNPCENMDEKAKSMNQEAQRFIAGRVTENKTEVVAKAERKWLPELGSIVDALSILQLKELLIPEHRADYAAEIQLVLHDLDLILKEHNINISANTIRAIIVLAQANLHIWHSEAAARRGKRDGNDLIFTHTENGVRVRARSRIQKIVGGRVEVKSDCLAAEFNHMEPSWDGK